MLWSCPCLSVVWELSGEKGFSGHERLLALLVGNGEDKGERVCVGVRERKINKYTHRYMYTQRERGCERERERVGERNGGERQRKNYTYIHLYMYI